MDTQGDNDTDDDLKAANEVATPFETIEQAATVIVESSVGGGHCEAHEPRGWHSPPGAAVGGLGAGGGL